MIGNLNTVKSFDGNWLIPSSLNFVLRGLQMLSYVLASMILLIRHRPQSSKLTLTPKDQERITFSWLKILVYCMLLAIIGYYASSLVLVFAQNPEMGIAHQLFILFNYICFIPLLTIPLALLTFPQILYGIPALHLSSNIRPSGLATERESLDTSSDLSLAATDSIDHDLPDDVLEEGLKYSAKAVMNYLLEEKPYLDKDFSMDKLAQALNLPRHHVYFCMNRVLKVKFPELRKQLRIQHAKQLLEQGKNKALSIEGIGIQSGFSSRSNFFTAFKTEVGCTPSEYLESISS
jgi:AraC-like DNA-binding protein